MTKSKISLASYSVIVIKSLKKKLLAIILFVIVLVAVGYLVLSLLNSANVAGKFEKSIVRNADTAEKENALSAAENANYMEIFNTDRFSGWMHNDSSLGSPNDYNSSATPSYAYANFVDAEVARYYDARFEYLKGKVMDIRFTYSTNVSTCNGIRAVYVPAQGNESMPITAVSILDSDDNVLDQYSASAKFAFSNSSGILETQATAVDFEFSNCYVVEMRLQYSEVHAPLAAFFSDVQQTVIVDENFRPVFLCIQASKVIS